MPTPASIRKHPIHPMLVGIPIGLWVFAVVADLVHMGGGGAAWKEVARYCIGGGSSGPSWPRSRDLLISPLSQLGTFGRSRSRI